MQDADSKEKVKEAWEKKGAELHKQIADYLAAYPKYQDGVEHLTELVALARVAEADKTRKLIVESVAGITSAAPRPRTARSAISSVAEEAVIATAEPLPKIRSPAISAPLSPRSRPYAP